MTCGCGINIKGQILPTVGGVQRPYGWSPDAVGRQTRIASFSEIGPVFHNPPAEINLLRGVALGRVERLAEDVVDLVGVHDTRPRGPRIGR